MSCFSPENFGKNIMRRQVNNILAKYFVKDKIPCMEVICDTVNAKKERKENEVTSTLGRYPMECNLSNAYMINQHPQTHNL